MMKTSYSTIFNEGLDFSTVLLDRDGDLIAEKNYTPSMMGAITHTVRWTLEEFGEDFFQPGRRRRPQRPLPRQLPHPRAHDDEADLPRRRADRRSPGAIGHVAEVGGKAPGSFASDATDVYQEGLRLPPVKLIEGGRYNEQLWRVILANHRTPRNTWGDFHAMIGALNVGERRLLALVDRYDLDTVREGARSADRLLRAAPARRDRRACRTAATRPRCWSRTTASRTDPFEVKVSRRDPRRRGDRRLHRLEPAGARADELHVRGRRLGRLQRRLLRHRSRRC